MATTSKRCRSCFIFAKPKYAHFCTGSCHRDARKTFTINCWWWVFHLAITSHPAALNWRQGERKPNSLLYNYIRHYHLIQAKPDVIKQESCNLSTFSPNVSRTAPIFSHNPSRNRQCNQAELPMKSIRYSYRSAAGCHCRDARGTWISCLRDQPKAARPVSRPPHGGWRQG